MKKNKIIKVINNQTNKYYVIVSPDEMNVALDTVIVCPLITTKRNVPTHIAIKSTAKSGLQTDCFLALEQITIINKATIISEIGEISECEAERAALILQEMFAL